MPIGTPGVAHQLRQLLLSRRRAHNVDLLAARASLDISPARSPQALHTAILPHVFGRDILEIGTRNGDGIACFAQVARSAVAAEINKRYCTVLERRAKKLTDEGNHSFSVVCDDYCSAARLDADLISWWQEPAHGFNNHLNLRDLAVLLAQGWLRANATAVLVFSGMPVVEDRDDLAALRRLGWLSLSLSVRVDEVAACHRRLGWGGWSKLCARVANTTFHAGFVPIRLVPLEELNAAIAKGCVGRVATLP